MGVNVTLSPLCFDKWEALRRIEEIYGTKLDAYPILSSSDKLVYTEINIFRMSDEDVSRLKRTIHKAGYRWQLGNCVGNRRRYYLTMISECNNDNGEDVS